MLPSELSKGNTQTWQDIFPPTPLQNAFYRPWPQKYAINVKAKLSWPGGL